MAQAPLQQRATGRRSEPVAKGSDAGPREQRLAALGEQLNQAPTVQRLASMASQPPPGAPRGGLPDGLRSGIEALSGVSMDGVRVHRNSSRPATVQARAFAQGRDIHLAPGQDHQLPHEAWHVVQQAKGRVRGTKSLGGGVAVNDDPALEHEADVMGARAARAPGAGPLAAAAPAPGSGDGPIQRRAGIEFETSVEARTTAEIDKDDPVKGFVTQDQLMAQGVGWQIDSDNSKLEFVTYPPVDIGALAGVATTMFDHVEKLPKKLDAGADLAGLLNVQTTKPYTVLPYKDRVMSGAPQGTVGIPFTKLFSFFDFMTKYQMKMSEVKFSQTKPGLQKVLDKEWKAWKGMPETDDDEKDKKAKRKTELIGAGRRLKEDETHQKAVPKADADEFRKVAAAVNKEADKVKAGLSADDLAKLKGLLHFIGQYVIYASPAGGGYEKKRFPVMSRSSFSSMYAALGKPAKDVFAQTANGVVTDLGFEPTTLLLPGRQGVTFDVRGWLETIVEPVDVTIPETPSRVMKADYMTAPGAVQHPGGPVAYNTDKSMGSMGLENGTTVVVELRRLKLLTSKNSFTVPAARKLVGDLKALIEGA
jgi:hypothetical protein